MIKKIIAAIALCFFIISCTQFLDEDDVAETNYTGDDGCVYCHINEGRLKALAVAEETSSAGGG